MESSGCIDKSPFIEVSSQKIHNFIPPYFSQQIPYVLSKLELLGSSCCGKQRRTWLVSMRTQVRSLALLSGLRIHCCRELWYRSQKQLGFCVTAVAQAGSLSSSSALSLGTCICCGCDTKKTKKNPKKTNKKNNLELLYEDVYCFYVPFVFIRFKLTGQLTCIPVLTEIKLIMIQGVLQYEQYCVLRDLFPQGNLVFYQKDQHQYC